MAATGPGGIIPGSYDASKLSQDQRQWLYGYFGNQGTAPVGYGGTHVSGDYGTNYANTNGTYGPDQNAISQAQQQQTDAKENQFLKDFGTAISGQPTAQNIYGNLADSLGVTQTQKALTGAQNTLNQIPNDTQQLATSMGGISAAQMNERNAVKSQEQAPLVSSLANTLGVENQNLGMAFQGTMQQQQNQLLPFQAQAQFLGQNAQNTFNAWSQENQQQFQQIFSKIQSDEQLSNEEAMAATNLANQLTLYKEAPNSFMNPGYLQQFMGGAMGLGGSSGYTSNGPWQVVG